MVFPSCKSKLTAIHEAVHFFITCIFLVVYTKEVHVHRVRNGSEPDPNPKHVLSSRPGPNGIAPVASSGASPALFATKSACQNFFSLFYQKDMGTRPIRRDLPQQPALALRVTQNAPVKIFLFSEFRNDSEI